MDLTNINDIKALLARHGFRFSKSMGQNFLTAAWVPEDIADSAGIDKDTGVLEIGPGIGCLTEQLSMRAGKVVSVEIDKALKPVLRETLGGCENVEIVFDDVLKVDIPSLLDEKMPGMRHVVCANLPYNVTGPVISKLLEIGCFDSVTVMIQREVARRICAKPGTGDYGAFTVFVNWFAHPELLFDVQPGCFIPQPKVTSSVIRLTRRSEPPAEVKSEAMFMRVERGEKAEHFTLAFLFAIYEVTLSVKAELIKSDAVRADGRLHGKQLLFAQHRCADVFGKQHRGDLGSV